MDTRINKALIATLSSYGQPHEPEVAQRLSAVFAGDESFLDKVEAMDSVIDDYGDYEPLREIIFDLLLMNFFAADVQKLEEDYLESEEWESIEEQTLDRGTELLNLLLYLRECADEDLEPALDDYLKEFLLVDEDEFQDEHRIYEQLIANQHLVDSSYEEIAKVAAKLSDEDEIADIFYPMVSFFFSAEPVEADWSDFEQHALQPSFDKAVYELILNYNKN